MTEQDSFTRPPLTRLVPLTDSRGRELLPTGYLAQPNKGSVALVNGEHGTAWQRHFSDGLWHRTGGGRARTWESLLTERNLVLVYDASDRTTTTKPGSRP